MGAGLGTSTFPQTNGHRLRPRAPIGPWRLDPQHWVSPFFQAPGTDQRHSVTLSCTRPRTVSTDGRHQRGVKGELHPLLQKRGKPSATTSSLRAGRDPCTLAAAISPRSHISQANPPVDTLLDGGQRSPKGAHNRREHKEGEASGDGKAAISRTSVTQCAKARWGTFSYTPELHVAFCPILGHFSIRILPPPRRLMGRGERCFFFGRGERGGMMYFFVLFGPFWKIQK